jgi:hypothetical protein
LVLTLAAQYLTIDYDFAPKPLIHAQLPCDNVIIVMLTAQVEAGNNGNVVS